MKPLAISFSTLIFLFGCSSTPERQTSLPTFEGDVFPINSAISPELSPHRLSFRFNSRTVVDFNGDSESTVSGATGESELVQSADLLNGHLKLSEIVIEGHRFSSEGVLAQAFWKSDKKGHVSELQSSYPGLIELGYNPASVFRGSHATEIVDFLKFYRLPEQGIETGSNWDTWSLEHFLPNDSSDLKNQIHISNEVQGWAFWNGRRVLVIESFVDMPPSSQTQYLSILSRGFVLLDANTFAPLFQDAALIMTKAQGSDSLFIRIDLTMRNALIDL